MRSSRMKFVALVFGVLGLLAAACSSSDDSAGSSGGPDKVKLTLQWVTQAQFAGYHAALDQGFYADENLDVTIQAGGPDINPIQLLISGDSDIVIQPFGVVLTSREAGADVVSMGQVFERGAFRLVSRSPPARWGHAPLISFIFAEGIQSYRSKIVAFSKFLRKIHHFPGVAFSPKIWVGGQPVNI